MVFWKSKVNNYFLPNQAKIKVALITSMPSDPVSRDRLKKSRDEAVEILRQIADLKSDLKDIRDTEKQTHNISPKYFNSLVKREYDVQYGAEKKTASLEAEQEAFVESDILSGRATPNVEQTEADDGAEDAE